MTADHRLEGARLRFRLHLPRAVARLVLSVAMLLLSGPALANDADVQTTWRLLDYVAVDYAGAVSAGKVTSEAEFAEMNEFSAQVVARLTQLPPNGARPALLSDARRLQAAIAGRSEPAEVAAQSRKLAQALLAAYPVPLAPSAIPDVARGAALYAQHCSSCHGDSGDGHGPKAAKLDPPPIAFTDLARARQRSLFALYQVISQGLDGTAMVSFDALPEQDRWALAFYAGGFAFPEAEQAAGERLWLTAEEAARAAEEAARARIAELEAQLAAAKRGGVE